MSDQISSGARALTPCLGQAGHDQCRTCARHRLAATMRPVVKLSRCAMYEPKPAQGFEPIGEVARRVVAKVEAQL